MVILSFKACHHRSFFITVPFLTPRIPQGSHRGPFTVAVWVIHNTESGVSPQQSDTDIKSEQEGARLKISPRYFLTPFWLTRKWKLPLAMLCWAHFGRASLHRKNEEPAARMGKEQIRLSPHHPTERIESAASVICYSKRRGLPLTR